MKKIVNIKGMLSRYQSDKISRYSSLFASLLMYAIMGTLGYSILTLVLGLYPVSVCLILACILFFGTALVFIRGKVTLAFFLLFSSVTFTVSSSLLYVGSGTRAHLYLLSAAIFFFLSESERKKISYSLALACVVEYFLFQILMKLGDPLLQVSQNKLEIFEQLNTFFAFGLVIYISLSHKTAVNIYEKKLRKINDETSYYAYFDELTGLKNRRLLYKLLDELIKEADELGRIFTVGILDIDDFKAINDTFGHLTGDEILKSISQIMSESLRTVILQGAGEEKSF